MRRLLLVLVLAFLGIALIKILPAAVFRAQVAYWQHRCLTHAASPDAPVNNGNVPNEWRQFTALMNWQTPAVATAFLHEMRTPLGERRLVAVDKFVIQGHITLFA